MARFWAADVEISMPVPPEHPIVVDFDGMGFTMSGLAHNITEVDVEQLQHPSFSPEGLPPEVT